MNEYPDIDALIERVRSEAQRPEYQVGEPSELRPLPVAPPLAASAAPRDAASASSDGANANALREPPTSADDFLVLLDDGQFIDLAYRHLLDRPADAEGEKYYTGLLRRGYGRLFVLAALKAAREKGSRPAHMPGLGLAPLAYNLWRVLRRLGLGGLAGRLNAAYGGRRQRRALADPSVQLRTLRSLENLGRAQDATRAEFTEELRAQEERLSARSNELAARSNELGARLEQAIGDLGMQQIHLSELQRAINDGQPALDPALSERLDSYYGAFELACRGEEAAIREGQRHYLELLRELPEGLLDLPVIDVGCGRGEWLELVNDESAFQALGIDHSPAFVAHCRDHGLEVAQGDAVEVLAGRPAASAAAVSAFHIVEHLSFPALFRLIEEAFRVTAPGGLILLETPNPENVLVGSHTFYHDFSHRNPVTVTSLQFLVGHIGFEDIEVRRLHPYGEDAYIDEQSLAAERLNGHLYGPQDFTLVGRKPVADEG